MHESHTFDRQNGVPKKPVFRGVEVCKSSGLTFFLDRLTSQDKQQAVELPTVKQSSPDSCLFDVSHQEKAEAQQNCTVREIIFMIGMVRMKLGS